MNKLFKLLQIIAIIFLFSGCSRQLDHFLIDFTKDKPSGVEFKNISPAESYGAWTDGKVATFIFENNLPNNFTLNIVATDVIKPNDGETFIIKVGDQSAVFVARSGNKSSFIHNFENVPSGINKIEITVPFPTSPRELGLNNDLRKLGIALSKLEITSYK